jgi:hypothetical protein
MRSIERIDNFLKLVDWNDLLFRRWQIPFEDNELLTKVIAYSNTPTIPEYWNENPDQRIGQVLINLNLIPDKLNIWNEEEEDILIEQGIAPENCLFWTSIFDKDGNKLLEPLTRLISDMDTDHIVKVIELYHDKLSPRYKQAFDNVLDYREEDGELLNPEY